MIKNYLLFSTSDNNECVFFPLELLRVSLSNFKRNENHTNKMVVINSLK